MQMVKDVEECVLRSRFAVEILDVVDYQGVDALIEIKEVVDLAFETRGCKLTLEKTGGDIKHTRGGILLLDSDAYGLDEVGLSDTCRTEDKQRVESLAFGVHGNRLTYRLGNLVALADAVVLKGIARIELRVDGLEVSGLEWVGRRSNLRLRHDGRRRSVGADTDDSIRLALNLTVLIYKFVSVAIDLADSSAKNR